MKKEIIEIFNSEIPFAVKKAYRINYTKMADKILALNNWRSVEDELPDWKMIQHETHSEAITDRVLIRRKNGTKEVAIIRKNNTPDWYNGHHSINFDEVTHWMPLPSEPVMAGSDFKNQSV